MKKKTLIATATFAGLVTLLFVFLWWRNRDIVKVIPGSYITNSIGMKLRLIEPGAFMMGSANRNGNERPVHKVKIPYAFYMGVTEVTQAQYEAIMGESPSHFQGPKYPDEPSRPVECVSWDDAQDFCRKLSQREPDRNYRLPTEAEWEYCCRAGSTTEFYWGDTYNKRYAWTRKNWERTPPAWLPQFAKRFWPKQKKVSGPRKVGSFRPNAWGLYDMHGNGWEWCQDWYAKDYYSRSPRENPENTQESEYRALRGGSWHVNPWLCRSALRVWGSPTNAYNYYGFRVVSVPQTLR